MKMKRREKGHIDNFSHSTEGVKAEENQSSDNFL